MSGLKEGDVLIFEEVLGPNTGEPADADPEHRHAVRLTSAKAAAGVTEIEWAPEDALPFPLCISTVTDALHGRKRIEDVSVALGNIVLADHGRTVTERLGAVPSPDPKQVRIPREREDWCGQDQREQQLKRLQVWPRFRPRLPQGPLTLVGTVIKAVSGVDGEHLKRMTVDPAAFRWKPEDVLPAITLKPDPGRPGEDLWEPRRDLLSCDGFETAFVADTESDGTTCLLFGDGQHGRRPDPNTKFLATYRVGNGAAGNVGAEAIAHIRNDGGLSIQAIRNPMPARGGLDPEPLERVRQDAPVAFRTQERAVTEADYAAIAQRHPSVQRAVATFRWTGSWYTVFLAVDPRGEIENDQEFLDEIRGHMERYRMAGYDLEIARARYVPLNLDLYVYARPDSFRGEVDRALRDVFSNRVLPDGAPGFFHPDLFTFAQPAYRSEVYAAAQAVAGVESVHLTRMERLDVSGIQAEPLCRMRSEEVTNGERNVWNQPEIVPGRLEIIRLDNDSRNPGNGVFRLYVEGGK